MSPEGEKCSGEEEGDFERLVPKSSVGRLGLFMSIVFVVVYLMYRYLNILQPIMRSGYPSRWDFHGGFTVVYFFATVVTLAAFCGSVLWFVWRRIEQLSEMEQIFEADERDRDRDSETTLEFGEHDWKLDAEQRAPSREVDGDGGAD